MNEKSVIVIGSGVGGIASAVFLARKGYKVTVLEKNSSPGGRCGQIIRDGYRFDVGATMFLIPELYEELFSSLGENIKDHLDLHLLDPMYRIHFEDESYLDFTSDLNKMQLQLESIESGSFDSYLHLLEEGRKNFDLSGKYLVMS